MITISFKILVLMKAWLFGKSLYIVIPIPVGGAPMKTIWPSSFSILSAVSCAHFHGSWSVWEAIPVSVSGAKIVSPTPQCAWKSNWYSCDPYWVFKKPMIKEWKLSILHDFYTFKYLLNAKTISIWWRLSRLVITNTFFAAIRPDSSNLGNK